MEHTADYYECLYKAREGRPEKQMWTRIIQDRIHSIKETAKTKPNMPPITQKEMVKATKKLIKGKSNGPDNIPNEIFIHTTKQTLTVYREILNTMVHNQAIPDEWRKEK